MASVQDHAPLIRELSERRQQDPQPAQRQGFPKPREPSDSLRPTISEPPRESSPPRFSQLHDPSPEATESNPSRRGTSTTNPSTLVNHPGTVSSGSGPATVSGSVQNAPAIQDRNYHHSLVPDRRPSTFYDPVRGEGAVQGQLSDDGDHDRSFPTRRVSIPRPLPIFGSQDGNGNRNTNGSGVALRGIPGLDWNMEGFREPQQLVRLTGQVDCVQNSYFCSTGTENGSTKASSNPRSGNKGARQVQEEGYVKILQETAPCISLSSPQLASRA